MTAPKIQNTEMQTVGSSSQNSEFDWIENYFNRDNRTLRFDGYGLSNAGSEYYYNPSIHPKSPFTRACVSVEWAAFAEIMQGGPNDPNAPDMVYVPCGISSGLRAHELLDQKNRSHPSGDERAVTTYKADEHLGGGVHHGNIMGPNKDDNLRRANIVSRLYPGKAIIAPVVREGAVREITRTGAFSRWQSYEEEDFMAFWYPVIDRCKGMVLDGDWNFSRNSIWEMMRGVLIQSGQVPSRPNADMDVRDLEGNPLTLLARAEKIVEMLEYQLGKGFEPREAATALAQIFTIDDDIRSGALPAEGTKLHAILENRSSEERAAMDALKEKYKPLLLSHCAQYMRLDDLPEEYRAAAAKPHKLMKKQLGEFSHFAEGISAHEDQILSVLPSDELRARIAQHESSPQRLFDSYERFFEKDSQAMMFEDDLYGKLLEWERLALPFAIGATETGLYPTAEPMATMVFADLKRGKVGFERAQEAGVADMNEVAGAMGRDIAEVISKNTDDAEALKAQLKAENPGRIVVNTPSFLRIADAIEQVRPEGFVAAPGASETSPQMRLALQMKYLDRNVDRAVFQEGWEHSNDLVQLRVRARLIQAGLVERPAGAQSALHVFGAGNPATPETLLDDIKLLCAEVQRAVDADIRAPEQALALARLVTLHELLVDPTLRKGSGEHTRDLINTLVAPAELTCYDREEAKTVIDEARTVLLGRAALWMPRERLETAPVAGDGPNRANAKEVQNLRMKDYLKAQDRELGREARAKQRTGHAEIEQRRGVSR